MDMGGQSNLPRLITDTPRNQCGLVEARGPLASLTYPTPAASPWFQSRLQALASFRP